VSRLFLFVLLPLLLVTSLTSAQQVPNQKEPISPATEKKALDLLDSVASRVSSLRNPENRILLSCLVADLLWKRDEKRARAIFESVTKDVTAMIAGLDNSDEQFYNSFTVINNQRQEVVRRMAWHDPDLALSFLRATRLPTVDAPSSTATWERNLEITLSRAVAVKDPDAAVRIARESLARGLSFEVVGLLAELSREDKSAAASLFESVVDRIKEEDLTRNDEAGNVAMNLITSFKPPQADERLYRELLEKLLKSLLSINPNDPLTRPQAENYFGNLQSSMPLFKQYVPTRVPALQDWSDAMVGTLDPDTQVFAEVNQISPQATADDILALAAKYPHDIRSQVYQQAAWKASSSGDFAKARQIVNDYISDPVQRRQYLQQLDNQMVWQAVNDNKISDARKLLTKAMPVDQRVQILLRLSSLLSSKEDKKGALECLSEARTLIATMPRTATRMWHQIQLAVAYQPLDLDQSFLVLQTIITRIIAATVVMDGFDSHYLKNGEWMNNGPSTLGNMVGNVRRNIAQLARLDFDRAQTLSDQVERPEIRLALQIEIVQGVFGMPMSAVGVRGTLPILMN
jgi:hypothetical protein